MPAFAVLLARRRIWVLAAAALLGLAAAGGLSPSSRGQPPTQLVASLVADAIPSARAARMDIVVAANDAGAPKAADSSAASAEAATPRAAEEPPKASRRKGSASSSITIDDDEGSVRISGMGGSREYDSFESFVERAPWIAGLVFLATFLVFLTPILIIALVIWYKMRKTRMLNETMVRLAEKGVVPPSEAFDAVTGGRPNPMAASPAAATLYEQAKQVRQKSAWSDLRKGMIMGAIGLGLTFHSMVSDGDANVVGLVLLFVGLGYIVLWYFEDRQIAPGRNGLPPPPPAPPAA